MKTITSVLIALPYTLLCILVLGGIAQAAPIPNNGIRIAYPMGTFLRPKAPALLLKTATDSQTLLNRRSGPVLDPVSIETLTSTTSNPPADSADTIVERIRNNLLGFLRSLKKKFQGSFEWVKTNKVWQWLERQGSKFWNAVRRYTIPNSETPTIIEESPQPATPLVLLEPRPMEDAERAVGIVPKVNTPAFVPTQGAGHNPVAIEAGNSRNGHDSANVRAPSWEHKGKWGGTGGDKIPAYPALGPNAQQMVTNVPSSAGEPGSAGYIDRWNAAVFQSLGAKEPAVDTGSDTRAATMASSSTGLSPGSETQPKPPMVKPASKPNTVATEPNIVAEPKTVDEPKPVAADPKSNSDDPKSSTQEPKIIAEPKPVTETQAVTDTKPVNEIQPLSNSKPVPESSGGEPKTVEEAKPVTSELPPKPVRPRRRKGWKTPDEKNRGYDDWPGKHPCVFCKDGDPGPDPPYFRKPPFQAYNPRDKQTWWEFLTTFGRGNKFIGPLSYDPNEHYYHAYKISPDPDPWKNPKTWVPTPRKPGEPVPEYEDYNPHDPKPLHPSKVQTWKQIQDEAWEERRTGKVKFPKPENLIITGDRNKHALRDWRGNLVKLPVRGDWELIPPVDYTGLTKLVDLGQYRLACQKLSDEQHIMAGLRPPERTRVDWLIRALCI